VQGLDLEVPTRRPGPPLEETLPLAELLVEAEAFAARERAGERVIGRYRLRASGSPLLLRHRTPDVGVFGEVFAEGLYEPPAEVAARLRAPVVLDAGANIGLFGLFARDRLGAGRVTSFEPDRFNLLLARRTVAANAADGGWELVEAAVARGDGELPFASGEFACSRIEGEAPGATDVVPAVDLLALLPGADLLKLDIEGGEWPILADPRLAEAGPPAVVLEYHPFDAPGADARAAAHDALARAGYATREVVHRPDDGVGMLWAWRPS
jgi:FkbM family methyltransferase